MATRKADPEKSAAADEAGEKAPELEIPEAVLARRRMLGDDFSKWVAAEDIYYDGGLAHKAGDPVPDTNVQRHGWDKTEPPLVRPAEG